MEEILISKYYTHFKILFLNMDIHLASLMFLGRLFQSLGPRVKILDSL